MMKDVIVELLIMAFFLLIGCLLFNGRGGCFRIAITRKCFSKEWAYAIWYVQCL